MSKLLFWVVVIVVALLAMRLLARSAVPRQRRPKPTPRRTTPRRVQSMVPCAHCGVHLPATEAVTQSGVSYCCAEHARAGRRA